LVIAGFISWFLKENINAVVILISVFLNTIIGFIQENKANSALEKLKKMVEHKALVIRDGNEYEIDSSQIVAGDLVILQAGNRVPSDGRIIEANDLQVNEANLTGEAMPAKKSIEKIATGAALADRNNMVYASTVIVSGSGLAIITATGNETEVGKIAELVSSTEEGKTPLQLRLDNFSRFISILILLVCFAVVFIGIFQGRDFFEIFITGVAIAVAAIPEGLSVAITVILVFGMQQILKKKALTRKLLAAETLGSTTVICTDKTGTLTEGKMQVSHIVIGKKEYENGSWGTRQDDVEAKLCSLALQIGMMCNEAVIENTPDELREWKIIGTPTEAALLVAAYESGLDQKKLLKIQPKVGRLPFSSEKKYMITLHRKDNSFIAYEKGAPEKIIQKSKYFFHQGKHLKLGQNDIEKLSLTYEKLTARGLRVIAVAMREGIKFNDNEIKKDIDWNKIDKDLTFIGFIALKDPLRKEAKETIAICQQAGIRPVIITGDHKLTAQAIAEEIGMAARAKNIITGDALDNISDQKLISIVKRVDIYARVSPHHKLRIVQALQACGEVVAMTGDGINDSPALKAADIGISLGTGTDIAKETSDLILLDNNFKTIVEAVKQGRIIFSNIRKVIAYLVSDGFTEAALVVGSILLNLPLAILPTQILWINIINDGFPNFSLAFEKEDDGVMKMKPIQKNEPIINSEMKAIIFYFGIIWVIIIFAIFLYLIKNLYDINYIRTLLFAILGVGSIFRIFSLKSLRKPIWKINLFDNKYLIAAVFASLSFLLAAIYFPPLKEILLTTSLGLNSWLVIILTGAANIFVVEVIKYFYINKKNNV
jgi:Ca2+-transporting ATPase